MDEQQRMQKMTLTVEEAGIVLGVSRSHAYEMVRQGLLPAIRLGKRWLISKRALMQMLGVTAEGDGHDDR